MHVSKHSLCPSCGYDLFNLPEDAHFVRCPECGESVDLETARAELRSKRVRETKLLAGLCAAASLPFFACSCLYVVGGQPRATLLVAVSSLPWLVAMVFYTYRHRHVSGAGLVLLLFHAGAVFFLGGLVLTAIGAVLLGTGTWQPTGRARSLPTWAVSLGAGVAMIWFARYLYSIACDRLEGMHDLELE